jgi:hypothetical protein
VNDGENPWVNDSENPQIIPISRCAFEKDAEVSNLLLNFQNIC